MSSSGPQVLKIVVESSVLDPRAIDNNIRPLSSEFQEIGANAMVEHESYRRTLKTLNSKFKFHYCTLCEKPHVADGTWEGSLCDCRLEDLPLYNHDDDDDDEEEEEATNTSVATRESREVNRRTGLRAAGDPRLSPEFPRLSSKVKMIRFFDFLSLFSINFTEVIASSGWLYRLSVFPLAVTLNTSLVFEFPQYNQIAYQFLSICIYIDLIREELTSTGMDGTKLLDVALYVLSADSETEREQKLQLLNNDEVCFAKFFCHDEAGASRLISAIQDSFWKILSLYSDDEDPPFLDMIKNIGNSIGIFLTTKTAHEGFSVLSSEQIQDMMEKLPQTFVWMPTYGGHREDYVPPVNRFAETAAEPQDEEDVFPAVQNEEGT